MAKLLETNLPNMAHQPELLSRWCDEIIMIFSRVKEKIARAQAIVREPHQDWLRNSRTEQGTNSLDAQQLMGERSNTLIDMNGLTGGARLNEVGGMEETVGQMGLISALRSLESGREVEHPAEAATPGTGRGSPLQRQRRR